MTDNQAASVEKADAPPAGRLTRKRHVMLAICIGSVLLTIVASVLISDVFFRDRTPLLTRDAYEAAAELWDRRGPASYRLELQLEGNRPGRVEVEVREGQVVRMVRDGVQPRQQRTWYYWTVPGQMDMIAEELEMAERPAESFNSPQASQMVMRAEFDPEYGYPQRYDRMVLGTDFEIRWKVTHFEPLDSGVAARQASPAGD